VAVSEWRPHWESWRDCWLHSSLSLAMHYKRLCIEMHCGWCSQPTGKNRGRMLLTRIDKATGLRSRVSFCQAALGPVEKERLGTSYWLARVYEDMTTEKHRKWQEKLDYIIFDHPQCGADSAILMTIWKGATVQPGLKVKHARSKCIRDYVVLPVSETRIGVGEVRHEDSELERKAVRADRNW